ncbi:PE domain-containing protein [Mycobacterium sp. 663a-19]|uniref:PPE family protein, SVP subgroup n=1 Tax=Mycobacterium sp. 663a-19 TaxID=2986148 RepID=UPI002D1EACF0|nr:PE domain-containing protein [Mycobacterium sp. 663a-19]MEB3980376.1 PE domain-containing protein [Mycobacterium sp. 663a-19]
MPLIVLPATLTAAAQTLATLGSNLATVSAGVAAPTTVIAPAGADSVSIQQAMIFSAFGTQLQAILAQAQDYQTQFETNLAAASDTYTFTEAANASQAALSSTGSSTGSGSFLDFISSILGGPVQSSNPGGPLSLSGNAANLVNIGGGNWASAGSDLLGLAGGGLLDTSVGDAAAGADLAGTTAPAVAPAGGMAGIGAMPMVAGVGQASMVGKLSVPPSWAGTVTSGTGTAPLQTVGWTSTAPQGGPGTVIPGMPGVGAAARSSAGFGAPRYGVKPIVMPKPAAV